jgi:uncharacterized membrane protein HdeD (DUF308 family)
MDMSEEGESFWITLAEKFIGLLLIIVSILMIYFTATSTNVLNVFTGLFAFLSAILLIGGAFLIIVKAPE